MVVKFTCPKGHPLSCDDERAGQSGKCPKCGDVFVVPSDKKAAEGGASGSSKTRADAQTGKNQTKDSAVGGAPASDMIVFLCPNGHKLNGPASLQGRAGQCPHCDAKFQIPTYEDLDAVAEHAAEQTSDIGTTVAEEGSAHFSDSVSVEGFSDAIDMDLDADFEDIPVAEEVLTLPTGPISDSENALAHIFTHLWNQRGEDGTVELFLKEGDPFRPEFFSIELSHHDYGVFAIKDEDSTFTITTIPWNSIARAVVRQVEELPPGLFE